MENTKLTLRLKVNVTVLYRRSDDRDEFENDSVSDECDDEYALDLGGYR